MGRHVRKKSARVKALPALAGVLCTGALFLALEPASSAAAASNPVRPTSVSSHGFGVLVEHDATLLSNESETGVAIGGTLTFGHYQVVDKDSITYTANGDSGSTALVAGAVNWAGSSGILNVTQSMGAKIGGTYDVNTQNSNAPRLMATGTGFDSGTRIDVTTGVNSVNPTGASGFDLPQLFASYRDSSDAMASLADTGVLRNDAGTGPWTSGNARLVLAKGQNVLTVTPSQLASIGSVNPGNGASLGSDTWLIVNVVGSGDITLSGPTAALGYSGGSNSQTHILWNFTSAGTLTINGNDQVEGTIFAPRAHVVDDSGKNIEGDVVAESLHQSGGEIHGFHFAHDVVTTPPSTPTTSASTTSTVTQTVGQTVTQTVTNTATKTQTATQTTTVTAPATTVTATVPGGTNTTTVTAPNSTATVTAPGGTDITTVTAPNSTATVTAPGGTDTTTVTAPNSTATVTAPGGTDTTTVTAPNSTATVTAPGATETVTAPGSTETTTVTAPASTETTTVTAPNTTDTVTAPGGTDTTTVTAPNSTDTVTAPGGTDTTTVTAPNSTDTTTVTGPVSTATVTAPGGTSTTTVTGAPTTVTSSGGVGGASASRSGSSHTTSSATHAAGSSSHAGVAGQSASRSSDGTAPASLANTGVRIEMAILGGVALLLGGVAMVLLGTRRGERQH